MADKKGKKKDPIINKQLQADADALGALRYALEEGEIPPIERQALTPVLEYLSGRLKDVMALQIALNVSCEEHRGCVKIIQAMVGYIRQRRAEWDGLTETDLVYTELGHLLSKFVDGSDPLCEQGVTLKPLDATEDDDEVYDRDPSHLKEPV